jgi:hypothetical protein
MQVKRAFAGLTLAVVTGGCLPASIHPLYESNADLASAPELVGTWANEATNEFLLVHQDKDAQYQALVVEGGEADSGSLQLRLVRCGGELFWDVSATRSEDAEGYYSAHLLPLHSFALVRLGGNQLEIAGLDQDWWKARLESGAIPLAFEMLEDRLLFTASPPELCSELGRHVGDPDAFSKADRYRRLS